MIVDINNENFKSEVLESIGFVIVDFYGSWCMPCKMIAPILEKISTEKNVKLAKIDIDEHEELVKEFNIMSVPTIKIFKDGKEIKSFVGFTSETLIVDSLK